MTANKVLGYIQVAIPILLIGGILNFAGPCVHDDGSVAACAQASWGIIGGGVFLLGVALAALVVESPVARVVCAVLCAALGVFIILAPGTIMPLCMMETMHCQAVMKPFAQICGGAAILVAIISAVLAVRR